MTVQFRLLGDVEAHVRGQPIGIGYPQLRCVLAVLLVEANHAVSVDQLVDRVWGDRRLPRNPRAAVQHSMTLLRSALSGAADVAITRKPPRCYQLDVEPETVDFHRFRRLVEDGRAADDDARAAALLEQALTLWCGEPFAGLTSPWLESTRATLILHRHEARLDLADVRLRLGLHAALLPDLAAWTAKNALDERLACQFMTALYRSGRPAEALDHYQRVRGRLADELGTDPSPPLRRLHEQVLAADPALAAPTVRSGPATVPVTVPRHLPAQPLFFTGRTRELADLDTALGKDDADDSVPISVIGGIGGIGKTWLALHWAYRHLDRFPDGQLYVNMRGFDPAAQPMPAETVVRVFLDALGVAPAAVPLDLDAQIGLYRSLVAGKKMLIFLDNAADTSQVAALLPGSPTCTALVTSRRHLSGLVAAHGARFLSLDRMTDQEAYRLLARHLGDDRLTAQPGVATELLSCCGGLPLAISMVGARATRNADFPLTVLADELRDQSGVLNALDTSDDLVSLRAVFSWSYRALSAGAAAVFKALGLAPGTDTCLHAIASLTALPTARARTCLRELEQAHLVGQHAAGRYRMHDLVRLYARERAHQDNPPAATTDALRRLVDFYLHTAHTADQVLDPHRDPIRIGTPADGCAFTTIEDEPAAMRWLATEFRNLLTVQELAARQGWHTPGWQVAWTLDTFFRRRGNYHDAVRAWRAGVASADRMSDTATQTLARRRLGNACGGLGLHAEALRHLRHALAVSEKTGDALGQAHAHATLGGVWEVRGDDRRALEHALPALRLYQDLDLPVWVAWTHGQVGWHQAKSGLYPQARTHCEAALALARRHRDRELEATTVDSLGYIAHHTGRLGQALDHYRQALALLRELGHDYNEVDTLDRLGQTYRALGHDDLAGATWRRAVQLCQSQQRADVAGRIQRQLDVLRQEQRAPAAQVSRT
ncbi:BTAD domain-containing putative transcriptional regulator [Actinosynnema sp. NPDC047251]|uniref:Transcriptional regulator, SARP family n=1 Tax=Saccharothrix espanaensis (strain ATCC 51144 / DSM 44229 / JCM 9112 / NBRC 15066 / NRRL 15764) TaxID=1179773 RepID=K0K7C2_SACES|nr:BTAD domain-containing putative transcriptional regulator [Saccharothrix espanaensis]CCH32794.1 Transcriptional regulator, SARP family [Saccharothrix espanaensis DSM 44229]